MVGTLIIGCGGTGCRVVKSLADQDNVVLSINWHDADISLLGDDVDENTVSKKDADEYISHRRSEISLCMVGFSDVILVTSPGGNLGSACLDVVRGCAADHDCRFFCLLTLPFVFEGRRRDDALEMLPEFVASADRTFVLDLQDLSMYDDMLEMSIGDAMNQMESYLASVSAMFAKLIYSMPFMSTFESRSYHYFHGVGSTLMNAAETVLSRTKVSMTPTSSEWRIVICPDGPVEESDLQELVRMFTDRYGSIPEVVRNSSEVEVRSPGPVENEGPGEGVSIFIPFSA